MSISYYKKLIEEKLGRYRSRLPIIKSMLSNGISIDNEGHYRAGPFKIPDSSLAKALNICLLYTSPSPRDRTRSRMPSSA